MVQEWNSGGVEKVGNFFCLTPPLSFLLTDGRILITNNFSLPSLSVAVKVKDDKDT